jgi:hypothetical protein
MDIYTLMILSFTSICFFNLVFVVVVLLLILTPVAGGFYF